MAIVDHENEKWIEIKLRASQIRHTVHISEVKPEDFKKITTKRYAFNYGSKILYLEGDAIMKTEKKFMNLKPEQILESYIIPSELNEKERKEEISAFLKLRDRRISSQSPEMVLKFKLMQFKIHLEDYLKSDKYIPEYNFSYFLKNYLEIININQMI
ncbi:hypothetical protein [Solitalea lacus]|uniref:hypothetical protein n=1 Tax=Solitalea lacus TaxID=2911172 RepID=UPI001EDAC94D|nr:hypothetical protein [Solitalea lacus]UKJ05812.1 hypothetical protein L2B55_09650 [Solitalea lacus]